LVKLAIYPFISYSTDQKIRKYGFIILIPILWYASAHLAAAVTNLFFVESVYPYWKERDPFFFENSPQVINGMVTPPDLPGLGLKFKEGLFDSKDVIVETVAGK
jgi:L-alanine-DL-glutamate epimerase-like enolase superfamily enzyme